MYVACVNVWVKEGLEAAFLEATGKNHRGSIAEPGCARFDVLRRLDEPGRFLLYEVYRDEAAALAHKETPHYLAWRDAVAEMMARPREGLLHESLFPDDAGF